MINCINEDPIIVNLQNLTYFFINRNLSLFFSDRYLSIFLYHYCSICPRDFPIIPFIDQFSLLPILFNPIYLSCSRACIPPVLANVANPSIIVLNVYYMLIVSVVHDETPRQFVEHCYLSLSYTHR